MEMATVAAPAAGRSGGAMASGEYWTEALKSFLDHIPVSSLSGALQPSPSPALELNLDACVLDAIGSMRCANAGGAVIVDEVRRSLGKFVDRDIGYVDFPSLVLWALEELDRVSTERQDKSSDFFSSLKLHPQIAETKIAWLAKLFLLEPFFPVRSHDTLFHAMLLFSKHHRLNVIPVVESVNSSVDGFVTQNAVMELLLQSSGLEWLDKIADKQLSEFRFANASKPVLVYSDETVAYTFRVLSKEKTGVAVIDRKNRRLIGMIQCSDVYLLLDDSSLFSNRKIMSAEEFVKLKNKDQKSRTGHSSESEVQSVPSLRSRVQQSVVTNRWSDTLKQAMENLAASGSSCSFIVDEQGHVEGVVTPRDVISVFSPPCMDSRIDGGTFFSAALEQAGCRVENGQMIRNT
ncbi:SNF1-related protein kinase regulatory subunit gamma-1-like [Triticum dicoccoides]|uniref:SNF1-related protein kinase regulatory subunit gamma-1-like n=1 Tax=Triticum dicoccoides TaxID=85692 RepID=UPI00188F6564|nr:SNF1-related protein kinase regulatory subunit gamma-1-like [Triticum dicoccoides]